MYVCMYLNLFLETTRIIYKVSMKVYCKDQWNDQRCWLLWFIGCSFEFDIGDIHQYATHQGQPTRVNLLTFLEIILTNAFFPEIAIIFET